MKYRIDSSLTDHLPLCGCGWRGHPAPSRLDALAQLSRHQHTAHPGASEALRANINRTTRRQARI